MEVERQELFAEASRISLEQVQVVRDAGKRLRNLSAQHEAVIAKMAALDELQQNTINA